MAIEGARDDEVRANRLLAGLSVGDRAAVADRLEGVDVEVRDAVYERGHPIDHVYFPTTAVYSFVALADGEVVVEVATIGREGFVGLPAFLGVRSSVHAAFCQVPGRALR